MDRLKAISVGLEKCAILTAELMVILSCVELKMEVAYSSEMFVPVSVRTAAYVYIFDVLFCVGLKFCYLA